MSEPENPESVEAVGRRLELTRIALGRGNATAFAKTLGVSPQSWSNYITGDSKIGLEPALRMARLYSVTTDWIYRGNTYGMPADLLEKIARAEADLEKKDAQKRSKSRRSSKTT